MSPGSITFVTAANAEKPGFSTLRMSCHSEVKPDFTRGLADRKCETGHKANEPFKHPVNLGDISMSQCVECHPRTK